MIADIHELVARIDIIDFVVHEERARRVNWPAGQEPESPQTTIRMAVRKDEKQIGYRFKLTLADSSAEYVADIEAVYEVSTEDEVWHVKSNRNNVGVKHLLIRPRPSAPEI